MLTVQYFDFRPLFALATGKHGYGKVWVLRVHREECSKKPKVLTFWGPPFSGVRPEDSFASNMEIDTLRKWIGDLQCAFLHAE